MSCNTSEQTNDQEIGGSAKTAINLASLPLQDQSRILESRYLDTINERKVLQQEIYRLDKEQKARWVAIYGIKHLLMTSSYGKAEAIIHEITVTPKYEICALCSSDSVKQS